MTRKVTPSLALSHAGNCIYWLFKVYLICYKDVDVVARNTTALGECCSAPESKYSEYKVQSGESGDITSEVLTFVDNSVGDEEKVQYVPNPIASADATSNTDLARFLSRPTLIDARGWTTASSIGYLGAGIEPWYLYLNNSVIKQKLTNYAYLRAKLCLKFVVNATPFHFGCLRVAYEPNTNVANTGSRSTVIRTNPTTDTYLLTPLSQLPGVWLHPSDNSGGHLELPFFKATNWLSLQTAAEAKTMGVLKYYIAAILGAASASASTAITIDTFAWLEDVELNAATAELTLQGKDEYDGPVSSVASAVASVSKRLETAPIIGKFARATTIGAGAIADIASMFGFTNVPVIDDYKPMMNMAAPPLASGEIGAPIVKLTLDPKQELSVDPSLHGIGGDDEMAISTIAQKSSVLTVVGWSTADTVGYVMFTSRVSPMLMNRQDIFDAGLVARSTRVYHTPMSYVGMMFQHWRGDIIYDFEVICTKFHKGRIKISWDPVGTDGGTALPENVVYTTILDIGETNKVSLRVPFHSAYAFCRMRGIAADNWNPGNPLPSDPKYDNGVLNVAVLTPLISPVSPQNLNIIVTVRAAPNLEFANLRSSLAEDGYPPPSFFAVQAKDDIDIETKEETFGDTGSQHPHRYALNFGECVSSLRSVAHRMSLYDVSAPGPNTASRFLLARKSYSRLPPMYGYDPNGRSTATKVLAGVGTAPFNFTPTHPMTYIAMMYGAFRGSTNYTASPATDLYPYIGDVRVQRHTLGTYNTARRSHWVTTLNSGFGASVGAEWMNNCLALTGGGTMTNTQSGGPISWNAPHMGPTNFNFCDPTYLNVGNPTDQTDLECTTLEILMHQATANTVSDQLTITTYAGSGVDWHCVWLLACPTLDYYVTRPAGV